MFLTIDVGNSRIKLAVFEKDTMLELKISSEIELEKDVTFLQKKHNVFKKVIISTVGKIENDFFYNFLDKKNIFFIDKNINFPFKNCYETPQTLGIDRLVLASGAVLNYPKKNRLIIDAGTCITYDFIDKNNNYLGGAISPGIRLRYESLHNYTAKLPLLAKKEPDNIIGNSTNNSIHSGVINGLTLEIDGFINNYSNNYENFIIILTGGDTDFLAKRLKNTIFANSNFLVQSLIKIYQYNQK